MENQESGKISLAGFDLPDSEMAIVDNTIRNYEKKLREKCNYEYLSIRMKKRKKGTTFLHEITGSAKVKNKVLSAKTENFNIFEAISDFMEKIINEAEHQKGKTGVC